MLDMGGRGNAAGVHAVLDAMIRSPAWLPCFLNFQFPYGLHGPEEYSAWLLEAGLRPTRVELVKKDMTHAGPAAMSDWIRYTWLPYVERVPRPQRDGFVDELVAGYLLDHPVDDHGMVHVAMVRLEVEAEKP